jgi:hypothetical protein
VKNISNVMRLPGFTAEAALCTDSDARYVNRKMTVAERGVRPARGASCMGKCLGLCVASGADGCYEMCACACSGGRNCPGIY